MSSLRRPKKKNEAPKKSVQSLIAEGDKNTRRGDIDDSVKEKKTYNVRKSYVQRIKKLSLRMELAEAKTDQGVEPSQTNLIEEAIEYVLNKYESIYGRDQTI